MIDEVFTCPSAATSAMRPAGAPCRKPGRNAENPFNKLLKDQETALNDLLKGAVAPQDQRQPTAAQEPVKPVEDTRPRADNTGALKAAAPLSAENGEPLSQEKAVVQKPINLRDGSQVSPQNTARGTQAVAGPAIKGQQAVEPIQPQPNLTAAQPCQVDDAIEMQPVSAQVEKAASLKPTEPGQQTTAGDAARLPVEPGKATPSTLQPENLNQQAVRAEEMTVSRIDTAVESQNADPQSPSLDAVEEKPAQTAPQPAPLTFAEALQTVKQNDVKGASNAVEIVQQITERIADATRQGNTTIHMELHPKDLGAIDVRLVISRQGLSVMMSAEQPATGRLLENQVDVLRQQLQDAGLQLANVNVNIHHQSLSGQQGGAFTQDFRQPASSNHPQEQPSTAAEQESAVTRRSIRSAQRVDTYI